MKLQIKSFLLIFILLILANNYCYAFFGKNKKPGLITNLSNFSFIERCGLRQTVKGNKIIISGNNNKTRVKIIFPVIHSKTVASDINDDFDTFFSEKDFFCSNYKDYDDDICPSSFFKSKGCCPIVAGDKECSPYWLESEGVSYKHNNFLSYYFTDSFYIGGAHESLTAGTYVYDLKTNKRLFIDDIFKDNDLSLTEITRLVKETLYKRFGEQLDDFIGEAPLIDNYTTFYIQKGMLIFVFQPYQVSGFAQGIQKVEVPIDDVLVFLNPVYFRK